MSPSKKALILLLAFCSTNVYANIDLSLTVHCKYQKGQFLTPNESENITNSKPMSWTFNGVLTNNPMFMSGGDTGSVLSHRIENGVSIYLPSELGSQSFTIWSTGESFWNKQYAILGNASSQQYIGTCTN